MRGSSRLEKGIDNCEETILTNLRSKDSLDGLAAVIAETQLGSLGSNKGLIQRTVGRFKSYKEDKLRKEQTEGEIPQDRLKPDKKLLLELTKLETAIVIKKRLDSGETYYDILATLKHLGETGGLFQIMRGRYLTIFIRENISGNN